MSDYETLVTRMTIVPAGEPLFHERGWTIEIEDESGGEFLIVRSHSDTPTEIRIDADEWPALRAAIDAMAARCRG
ncbi:MAG: hypothetical protein EOM21_14230 [Gammaproteobacteria bacterium]|nr:hypothetical protein [Gammaproteobacteria bacterium]